MTAVSGEDLRRFDRARRRLRARAILERGTFTLLHELEVPNTFELLVGRGSISREECRAIHAQLQDDLDSQRLARVPVDLDRVFMMATDLSRTYTVKALTRSLDLLHVAAARVMM